MNHTFAPKTVVGDNLWPGQSVRRTHVPRVRLKAKNSGVRGEREWSDQSSNKRMRRRRGAHFDERHGAFDTKESEHSEGR